MGHPLTPRFGTPLLLLLLLLLLLPFCLFALAACAPAPSEGYALSELRARWKRAHLPLTPVSDSLLGQWLPYHLMGFPETRQTGVSFVAPAAQFSQYTRSFQGRSYLRMQLSDQAADTTAFGKFWEAYDRHRKAPAPAVIPFYAPAHQAFGWTNLDPNAQTVQLRCGAKGRYALDIRIWYPNFPGETEALAQVWEAFDAVAWDKMP